MKSKLLLVMGITFALLSSCKQKDKDETPVPIRVEILSVTESPVNGGRSYSGVIEESSGTTLSFKAPGTISQLNVAEGQRVNKGQLIASLDGSSLRSNYEIAKSTLATAQDTYNRMKVLHDAKALPEMKWVEVSNSLSAAKSACQIAQNALNDTHIYAPFSGVISQKYADAGSTVAPAVPVVKLVEISPVKASIAVAENEIGDFEKGTVAEISVEALNSETFEGTLIEKGVAADPLSRTYNVKFLCNNPNGKLLPGMLCTVVRKGAEGSKGIVVPMGCVLLDDQNNSFVWLAKNGKAEKRVISLGAYTPDGVIVESGLAPGEEVIVSGQQKVSNGMSVQPINK